MGRGRGLDRRDVLVAGAALGLHAALPEGAGGDATPGPGYEQLLGVHANTLPEADGRGSNHYPMAAEALLALDRGEAAFKHLRGYDGGFKGIVAERTPIEEDGWQAALGSMARYGDWRAYFRRALAATPWKDVLATWAERLAPGMVGAACHGVIRTGHATRALTRNDRALERRELACGLAYWAARFLRPPTTGISRSPRANFEQAFGALTHPFADRQEPPVHSFSVEGADLDATPFAPRVVLTGHRVSAERRLDGLIVASARYFRQMAVAGRHGILLLHAVTGPGAVALIVPHVPRACANTLAEHAWQASAAMFAAYGLPYRRPAGTRTPGWPRMVDVAVGTNDAHAIKLTEVLLRTARRTRDRSLAEACWTWIG